MMGVIEMRVTILIAFVGFQLCVEEFLCGGCGKFSFFGINLIFSKHKTNSNFALFFEYLL